MTLINPFVPFTDLEPLEYRREPLGEKGGVFFYNTDEEHASRYARCGGVIYPEVTVSTISECRVITAAANGSSSSSSSLESGGNSATLLHLVSTSDKNKHNNKNTTSAATSSSSSGSSESAYAPALTSALKTLVSYCPPLSYFTYQTDAAAKMSATPGEFFFRLDKDSPFYNNFQQSKFSAQAMAFHPYFPIIAVAEQRSPFEASIIRFYDVANSSFIESLTLTHPKMKGVTTLKWKPFSRDVLAVGVFGGVMVWSVHGLIGAMENHVAAKMNGKLSLLRGGATNPKRGQRPNTSGVNNSYNYDDNANTVGLYDASTRNSTNASALLHSAAIGEGFSYSANSRKNNNNASSSSSIAGGAAPSAGNTSVTTNGTTTTRKRQMNELTHILGATTSFKAATVGIGSVDWSRQATTTTTNADGTVVAATASNNNSDDPTTAVVSKIAAGFPLAPSGPAAHFLTYGFSSEKIPVTTVAFSELNGGLMAVASRGSPDTLVHNIACRPRDSLLVHLPNYSVGIASNVSFLQFSMDDKLLIRGYESANRLSVTTLCSLKTKHFVTPAPILKVTRLECVGFNVYALMMKDVEAVTIAHIAEDQLTILANVVTGVHGVGAIGGAVLDICASSYNLYVRVTSGHILVMTVSGESNNAENNKSGGGSSSSSSSAFSAGGFGGIDGLGAEGLLAPVHTSTTAADLMKPTKAASSSSASSSQLFTGSEIGVQLKGGIPCPRGNRHVVTMDTFQSFVNGALLAVGDGERGTIRLVPSYFTRGVNAGLL